MDEDVAYVLGLIAARGKFIEEGDNRRLIIDFPYRNLDTRAPEKSGIKYKVPERIQLSLIDVKTTIDTVLGTNIEINHIKNEAVQFLAIFSKNTMSWRNLRILLKGKSNYYEFELNESFFGYPKSIIKCFIRGFSDASAMPSVKDADTRNPNGKRHRIVLQFPHSNWILPIQICKMLQESLEVPVAHILWGHPSMNRDFREHRMRIYVENFENIGFGFAFKNELLKALIEDTQYAKSKCCNPKAKKSTRKKERNSKEKDESLPNEVRRHFDYAWKICLALGCKQGKKRPQLDLCEEWDEIDEK